MARRARGSGKRDAEADQEQPETDGARASAAVPPDATDRVEDPLQQPASDGSERPGTPQNETPADADATGAKPAAEPGEAVEQPASTREDETAEPAITQPDAREEGQDPGSTSPEPPTDEATPAEPADTARTDAAETATTDAAPADGAGPGSSGPQGDAQTGQTDEQAGTDPQATAQTQQDEPDRAIPSAPAMPPPPPSRRGGFMAPLLGGIVAAGLGAGAVLYFLPEGWQPASDPALERRIVALEERPAPDPAADVAETVQSSVDSALQPLEERIAALENQVERVAADAAPALPAEADARIDALETALEGTRDDTAGNTQALASLAERLGGVESALAALPELDLATEDLSRLAERVTALEGADGAALDERIDAAVAEAMAEARAEQETRAQEISDAADELARVEQRVAARAALARLTAAAESGAAEPAALQDIAAVTDPPEGLDAFADGLATLGALQDSFPDLARAALNTAPPPPDAGVGDRVIGFLRQQTGARSLAPRDGDDPDALLSRAEAQLRQGQLAETLETLQALPAESTAVLSEWKAQAQARLTALQGLETLRDDLGTE